MAQITWRNINGPSNAGVADLLRGAQQSVSNAFTGLNTALNQYKTTQEDQAKQQFLDSLAQIRDPQAYQQALQNGTIDQLRQQAGPWLPSDVYRDALDNRLTKLQERDLTTAKYEDTTRTRNERDIVNRTLQSIYEGKFDEAAQLIQENDTLSRGTLAKQLRDARRDATRWEQEDEEFGWRRYDHSRNVLENERDDAAYNAQQLANRAVLNTVAAARGEQAIRLAGLRQLADQLNIPIVGGQPDLENPSIPPDIKQQFLQQANAQGLLNYTHDTNRLREMEWQLLNSGLPVTPEMLTAARQTAGTMLQGLGTLAPADQAQLDEHLKKVDTAFEEALGRNALVKAALDPVEDSAGLLDFLTEGGWDPFTFFSGRWFNDGKAMNLVEKINSYLAGGLSLEGEPDTIKVTPGLVKLALKAANAGGSSATAETFEEALKQIAGNPEFLKAYKEGLTAREDWETNRAAVIQRFRQSIGMPPNRPSHYIQSLNLMVNN